MILVPVKNLDNAKQRLSQVLKPEERYILAEAMLQDVLEAISKCSLRNEVAVVSGDTRAIELARNLSFEIIADAKNPGETEAVEMATQVCVARGSQYTLVVPGDIPLIRTEELESIFAAASEAGTVLVPSASGRGTNAVLRRPGDLFPLRFGNDSFLPHLWASRATGMKVTLLKLSGIGLDVDDPDDLAAVAAMPGATRTQRLLQEWSIRRAPIAVREQCKGA